MIKVICDKCGIDCGRVAFEICVSSIHNPTPLHVMDIGESKITDEKKSYRFILCQTCYRQMGFPNYYKVTREGILNFRDNKVITKDTIEEDERPSCELRPPRHY